MEIKGTITNVLPVESGTAKSGNAWSKMTFAIQTGGEYPKTVALELMGKSLDFNKDKLRVGQVVTVKFDPSSRDYNGKYYTQLNAYNVEINAPAEEVRQESSGHFTDDSDKLPWE